MKSKELNSLASTLVGDNNTPTEVTIKWPDNSTYTYVLIRKG